MPGPISDSYDPEWGTRERAGEIQEELDRVYALLSEILGGAPPIYILELVGAGLPGEIPASLPEKDWGLLRFAVERARDSI